MARAEGVKVVYGCLVYVGTLIIIAVLKMNLDVKLNEIIVYPVFQGKTISTHLSVSSMF